MQMKATSRPSGGGTSIPTRRYSNLLWHPWSLSSSEQNSTGTSPQRLEDHRMPMMASPDVTPMMMKHPSPESAAGDIAQQIHLAATAQLLGSLACESVAAAGNAIPSSGSTTVLAGNGHAARQLRLLEGRQSSWPPPGQRHAPTRHLHDHHDVPGTAATSNSRHGEIERKLMQGLGLSPVRGGDCFLTRYGTSKPACMKMTTKQQMLAASHRKVVENGKAADNQPLAGTGDDYSRQESCSPPLLRSAFTIFPPSTALLSSTDSSPRGTAAAAALSIKRSSGSPPPGQLHHEVGSLMGRQIISLDDFVHPDTGGVCRTHHHGDRNHDSKLIADVHDDYAGAAATMMTTTSTSTAPRRRAAMSRRRRSLDDEASCRAAAALAMMVASPASSRANMNVAAGDPAATWKKMSAVGGTSETDGASSSSMRMLSSPAHLSRPATAQPLNPDAAAKGLRLRSQTLDAKSGSPPKSILRASIDPTSSFQREHTPEKKRERRVTFCETVRVVTFRA